MKCVSHLGAAVTLLALAAGQAVAVDFGERTPELDELVSALKPPRTTRGAVGVAGAGATQKGRASMQIGFDFGSSRVLERDLPKLKRLSEALNSEALKTTRYLVIGHTDATGSMAVNMKLSRQRADSVMIHLVGLGIEPARLSAEGRGPTELLNKEHPGAAENRRVELAIQR